MANTPETTPDTPQPFVVNAYWDKMMTGYGVPRDMIRDVLDDMSMSGVSFSNWSDAALRRAAKQSMASVQAARAEAAAAAPSPKPANP